MASSPPVVLISGANQGLGYSIAEAFSKSSAPYTILIGSRSLTRGEEAAKKLSTTTTKSRILGIQLDITSSSSISSAASMITSDYGCLDILINNAGIGSSGSGGIFSSLDDFKAVMDTNVIGTATMTETFVPLLRKSKDAKIIVLSSTMGSISMAEKMPILSFDGTAYRASKAALNMMIVEWAKMYKNDGIRVWGVDPGLCATNFIGDYSKNKGRDPAEGAQIVMDVIEGKWDAEVGKVIYDQWGESGVRPW